MSRPLEFANRLRLALTSAATVLLGAGAFTFNSPALAQQAIKVPPILPTPPKLHIVPEMNTGLILVPIVIAILLFSSRRLLRRSAAQDR
jgi:hypothetical protein